MTILVTGAAGFIGSHVCERLLTTGEQVIGVDNFDPFYDPEVKKNNLSNSFQSDRFQLVSGDIRDQAMISALFQKHTPEAVIHLAAKTGVRPSIEQAAEYVAVNLQGTLHLLEAARTSGTRRFLFASSSSVYGNQKKTPFSETDDVGAPISPYAATKQSGELLCHTYHHLYGLETACMRFFTVYGPRQRPDLAIHKFTHHALAGKPVQLFGDGLTRRDYTFIDDIVDGVEQLLYLPDLHYDIFNLGNGQPVALIQMVEALEKALRRPLEKQYTSMQPGDVDQTYADISKAAARFGYRPKISLEEGVRQFLAWHEKRPP